MKFNIILPNQSIKTSINKIKKNGMKGLVVVNHFNKLLGTLTDGDLRKALLTNFNLNNQISKLYNKKPDFLIENEYSIKDVEKIFYFKGLTFIPIIKKESSKLVEILTLKKFKNFGKNKKIKITKKISCVIMAGGRGTRLKPFTDVLPKPLLPLQKSTVIEKIIKSFEDYGIKNFIISVNYKSEILKAFFKELNPEYKLSFIEDRKPLGTAGSLSKLSLREYQNIFVSNCDTIINVDLFEMHRFHIKHDYDITILASSNFYQVPYGVCHISEEGNFKEIREKPKFNFLSNVGIYLIKNNIIKLIPKDKKIDFTQLIKIAKLKNKKIGVFITGKDSWFDVGQWHEFNKTIENLKK